VKTARREDALLAGVCADIAGRFGWNVWALRALFVVFLLVKTFWAIVAYAALAVMFRLLGGACANRRTPPGGLESPELADRNERIADLERRFRDLEATDPDNS
jgi:phage shock protein PspC (stress-responsive transcriptional regulator)